MNINKQEFTIRMALIDLLEKQMATIHQEITNRKSNILQTWYGMKLEKMADHDFPLGCCFTYKDETFLDVDHAMEYAEEHLFVVKLE